MRIAAVACAFPDHYYPQDILLAAAKQVWNGQLENPDVLDRIYSRLGVEGRHLALPLEAYSRPATFGETNTHWIKAAEDLGEKAIGRALAAAGIDPAELSALFVVSVTGIASPSIDARLINRMRLAENIKRIPIFGLGCVGGASGLARAADYVLAYPGQVAAVLSIEICSLTLQRDDLSVANLISSGLFGDGAAAALVAGADRPSSGPQILASRSVFYPGSEEVMGWDISQNGFKIMLSPKVPDVVREHLAQDVDAFLTEAGLDRDEIASWVIHCGGPKVLRAVETALDLRDGALDASWDCLRRVGNLSSASVLMVLEETMMRRRPPAGSLGLLIAMGPGFCSELVLLRW